MLASHRKGQPGRYLEIYGQEEHPNAGRTVYGNQVERKLLNANYGEFVDAQYYETLIAAFRVGRCSALGNSRNY